MDTDFDFKPINEGLGFHRKVKPLDAEADSDELFSFSTLGPGTLNQPAIESNSREQSKGLLSSGPATTSTPSSAKSKHNAKSVSDLIAALPPSLDFLLEDSGKASNMASATPATTHGVSPAVSRRSPLFGMSSGGIATPGAPAAASMGAAHADAAIPAPKRGFLKMPLGRNDYGAKTKNQPASIDENVAKTFPTVFPHLGSLAGKPAAATVKAPLLTKDAASKQKTAKSVAYTPSVADAVGMDHRAGERPLSAHFGSAILDTLVAIGLGCILLALALSITGANLLSLLENGQTDRETISALAILFVSGGLLYVLAGRSFLGATLGEWSYEIRVGRADKRSRWFYPLLVVWRGLLVVATGFVVFPIVSLIAGTDVLKYLTGLELVSLARSNDSSIE